MLDHTQPFVYDHPETPPTTTTGPSALSALDVPPQAHSVLVLEPDNVRNAVLRTPGRATAAAPSKPIYVVRSDDRGDGTEIQLPGAGAEAATIHRKALAPSVTLAGTRVTIKRWLRPTST
jgi:hypothetical protein